MKTVVDLIVFVFVFWLALTGYNVLRYVPRLNDRFDAAFAIVTGVLLLLCAVFAAIDYFGGYHAFF